MIMMKVVVSDTVMRKCIFLTHLKCFAIKENKININLF